MSERERQHGPEEAPGGEPPAPERPNPLHCAGDELLAAADAALRNALSGDSERFLRDSRQEGGE